jgi:hypothetical protein
MRLLISRISSRHFGLFRTTKLTECYPLVKTGRSREERPANAGLERRGRPHSSAAKGPIDQPCCHSVGPRREGLGA